jgi:hypothetical protein
MKHRRRKRRGERKKEESSGTPEKSLPFYVIEINNAATGAFMVLMEGLPFSVVLCEQFQLKMLKP